MERLGLQLGIGTVPMGLSALQVGADYHPDNPDCGKKQFSVHLYVCACTLCPEMSVIQGSVWASGKGNMQLIKVERQRECNVAAPLLILDITHSKVFINFQLCCFSTFSLPVRRK